MHQWFFQSNQLFHEVPKPPDGDIKGDEADKERLKRFSKKRSVRTNSRFKRSKRIRRRRSPEEYPYRFTINDSNHEFTTEEIGGEIKFSNIKNIYDSQQLEEAGLRPHDGKRRAAGGQPVHVHDLGDEPHGRGRANAPRVAGG